MQLLLGSAGILLWSFLLLAGGARVEQLSETPAAGRETASVAEVTILPAAPRYEMRVARPIRPEQFAMPFAEAEGPLERLDDRKPSAPPRPQKTDVTVTPFMARPGTVMAGALSFGSRSVRLLGLKPTESGRSCRVAGGAAWPCGMVARAQQRAFLRNRAVTCDLPAKDWQGMAVARCSVGGIDIGHWLAENGWAEAEEGSELAGLTDEARLQGRGLFGTDPRGSGGSRAADRQADLEKRGVNP